MYFLFHGRVPVVFDAVVGPALEHLRDLGPLVAELSVLQIENPLFVFAPRNFLDFRVQVVVPALSALLADAAGQVLCDLRPLLRPVFLDEQQNELVFFGRPGALDEVRVKHFLPAVQALHVGAADQRLGDFLPVFGVVLVDGRPENGVFFFGPVAFGRPSDAAGAPSCVDKRRCVCAFVFVVVDRVVAVVEVVVVLVAGPEADVVSQSELFVV